MDILISGGSGFLGSAFSDWVNQNYKNQVSITWLTRNESKEHPSFVSMMSYDELQLTQKQFDVVINLAGAGIADERWTEKRKQHLYDSRIKPTQSIIDYIARIPIKPKLLVSGSAIGWYGAQGDKPLNEQSEAVSQLKDNSTVDSDFAHELCERWEKEALSAAAFGTKVVILRTGVVIHPYGGMMKRLLTPFKMGTGGKLGNGKQIMSWISREDWVRATWFIIQKYIEFESKKGESLSANNAYIYNLTAPKPVTNSEFTKTLGEWLNRPTFMTLPAAVIKMMFGDMSTLLIDGQKVIPQALLDAGFEFHHNMLKQALESQE